MRYYDVPCGPSVCFDRSFDHHSQLNGTWFYPILRTRVQTYDSSAFQYYLLSQYDSFTKNVFRGCSAMRSRTSP